MDNLKRFLAVLVKYQFWVICGTVLLAAVICWWLATASLASQFKERKTKLEGDFKGVTNIERNHPNQGVIDKINQQHQSLKRSVYGAWEVLYREQKEKNPLPTELGPDFKRQFESLKPKEELDRQYREVYQNFIAGHIPPLLKLIDVRRPAGEEKEGRPASDGRPRGARAAGAGPAGGRMAPEGGFRPDRRPTRTTVGPGMAAGARPAGNNDDDWVGTVEWNESDYRALESRFEWEEAPSTLAVILAQEDLWVYEALLRIIKDTNEGATSHATAAIKRIEALEIGKDAAKAWRDAEDSVFKSGQAAGVGGPGAPGMMPPGGPAGMRGGEMTGPAGMGAPGAAGASAEEQSRRQLIENRYVDDKGKPLPYDSEYPYAKHPYAEFKMMPIRLSLVMDQRRLPKLLVECANSNMPIEVRRIRLLKNPGTAIDLASGITSTVAGAGAPPMAGMAMPREFRAPPSHEHKPDLGGGGALRPTGEKEEGAPLDMPVEIHGVIYIYNPPDREKLGTGAASAEKSAEGVAPAAPAATLPPLPAGKATPPADRPAAAPTAPVGAPAGQPRGQRPNP